AWWDGNGLVVFVYAAVVVISAVLVSGARL
ncbi:unnamed protein product, partial [marine sediment metagenome]